MKNQITTAAFAVLLLVGCTVTGPDNNVEPTELEEARQAWSSFRTSNYDLEILRGCFCMGAGELTVLVRNDSVAAVLPDEEVWTADTDWWEYIPTVEDLFDLIEEAEADAHSLSVQYSSNGYPVQIDIDWIEDAVDDEITYTISALTHAPESDLIVLSLGESKASNGASISFESVDEESRCARNVSCIWPGRAIVTVKVDVAGQVFRLSLFEGATRNQESRQGEAGGVTVTLTDVSPYPIDQVSVALDDYQVRLLIQSN